jgi:hypothetical protein
LGIEGGGMSDWQMTYNGLTIGAGTTYGISAINGLGSIPEIRSSDQDRTRVHGQYAGLDLFTGRDIDVEVTIPSKHPSDSVWQAFSAAFVGGQETEIPLVIQMPGIAGGSEIQVNARVRKLSMPMDMEYYTGTGRVLLQFHATDPRLYSTNQQSVSTNQATTSGGLTFNATFNLSFGGAITGGQATVTNSGEFSTPWEATIAGPVVDPRIINNTTGQVLSFTGSIGASESLVVSSLERTVLLNGTASRYRWLNIGSQWWDLPPGNTVFQYAAGSGAGSLTVTCRSAWI